MSKKDKAMYVCERCGMIIGRTAYEISKLIAKFGGVICRRCGLTARQR